MEHPRVFNVNFSGHNIEDAKRDVPFQIFDGSNYRTMTVGRLILCIS